MKKEWTKQMKYFIMKMVSSTALMLAAITISQCCIGATYQPPVNRELKNKINACTAKKN